ncbi:FAD binding domain-containing protein [Dyadobacter fanqingshengii]|uniref:Xanthine dehydrogenase family protein subunit M n=1 Tax=Dyadobacter fanqingshengii TaxID=2906443 RepID=A0A9X1PAG2_9BACT|nr:xanthine dehydrogenase family protein subunit M [Dyadobacter fanqingshengii]MCF0040028.1 xanthine dehydrogenase family protein subunit M [Dyadobacter fanqingshengii]USJ38220.1 xanthine dehydrogenase family protein subunit M [Dyadobacter fanqingshengii]
MRPFKYTIAKDVPSAIKLVSNNPNARFLAGGTNLLDLMKEDVERPDEVIDITRLGLTQIKATDAGGISIGGLGRNTDAANHPLIRQHFPLLTQAILAGASGQIRNMASNGGNLLQRTRCPYFYDVAMPCNKREPGSGCGALEGINRMHAIFGWSEKCIAVFPSDMAVALAALDALVKVKDQNGEERSVVFTDFHRLPGDTPEKDTNLAHGELITAIEIPKNNFADHSYYLKVRDRASYAFALVSVAAALELTGNVILQARIAMGGVAHKPWRATKAEQMLVGKEATEVNFKLAADAEMADAKPLEHNKFKVELGNRSIVRALQMALDGGKS